MDNKYIIFSVLIECEENGIKRYDSTTLSDYMNGQSEEQCWEQTRIFCEEAGKKFNAKWILCGSHIVTF